MTIPRIDGSWPPPIGSNSTVSDFVRNQSSVPGNTLTDALNNLAGATSTLVGCVQATDFSNFWPTAGDLFRVLHPPSGTAFAYAGASALALSANCLLTYTGATRLALATLTTSCDESGSILDTGQYAIAHNGDVLGVTVLDVSLVAKGGIQFQLPNGHKTQCNATQRLVTLASGDTLQPAFNSTGADPSNCVIDSLTFSVILL